MRRDEATQVVASLSDPAQWEGDDYSRACRSRVDSLEAVEREDGTWAVRMLFHQGPNRMGVECGDLEAAYPGCTPEDFAVDLRLFVVEEPHGEQFGSHTDAAGRRWLAE